MSEGAERADVLATEGGGQDMKFVSKFEAADTSYGEGSAR